jgi:glutamate-1-semialdehyde 2,1-aminomutase
MKNHYQINFLDNYTQVCAKPLPVPQYSTRKPPVFKFGKQTSLTDFDNNDFTDYYLAGGRLIQGHAPANVILAVKKYAERGIALGSVSPAEMNLAGMINGLYHTEITAYFHSELTALLAAVNCARNYTGRNKIAAFAQSRQTAALKSILGDTLTVIDLNSGPSLNSVGNDTAAVIFEPVMTKNFITDVDDGRNAALNGILSAKQIMLIRYETSPALLPDENNRSAFAGVPAIFCLGGCYNTGFGFGMLTGAKDILAKLPPHSQGNLSPSVLNAAYASLRSINDKIIRKLLKTAAGFAGRLSAELCGLSPELVVHNAANMFALQLRNDPEEHRRIYARLWEHLLENGIYFPPGETEPFFICTKHRHKDMDKLIAVLKSFMKG